MSGSNRGNIAAAFRIAILVGGVALWATFIWNLSASYSARDHRAAYNASQYAEGTKSRVARACSGAQGAALLECVTEQVASSRENQRNEFDLQAQQDSAEAAFWMMVIGAATLFATVIALWFVKGTLDATKDAVREAGAASIAASATAEAYVSVERARLVSTVSGSAYDVAMREIILNISAENIGKSTGYVERVGWEASAHNGPLGPLVLEPVGVAIHAEQTGFVIVIRSTAEFNNRPYIKGALLYRSAFQRDHYTYFCYRIEPVHSAAYGPSLKVISDMGAHWPENT